MVQVEEKSTPVLRVTPMVVLDDIEPALARYEELGFTRVTSGDSGCIGMAAGQTALILASTTFMSGDDDAVHVNQLVGQTIKYVHVASVKQASARLPASARILQDVHTRGGTRELLVRDTDDVLILAETVR